MWKCCCDAAIVVDGRPTGRRARAQGGARACRPRLARARRRSRDAKGLSVIQAMAVIALKRSHRPPGRDVIVLATADEETGGAAGAGWLVHHRRELLGNAEYLLTEGDHIHLRGGRKIVQVSVAEKTPCWVKLVAHGESGHGSTPPR